MFCFQVVLKFKLFEYYLDTVKIFPTFGMSVTLIFKWFRFLPSKFFAYQFITLFKLSPFCVNLLKIIVSLTVYNNDVTFFVNMIFFKVPSMHLSTKQHFLADSILNDSQYKIKPMLRKVTDWIFVISFSEYVMKYNQIFMKIFRT